MGKGQRFFDVVTIFFMSLALSLHAVADGKLWLAGLMALISAVSLIRIGAELAQ